MGTGDNEKELADGEMKSGWYALWNMHSDGGVDVVNEWCDLLFVQIVKNAVQYLRV